MEDIINRGGGNLIIELYNTTPDDKLDSTPVHFKIDGINRTVEAGDKVVLTPGESICLEPHMYHRFYGEPGKGKILVGEVSMVNDDKSDNCVYEKVGRFPPTFEDVAPLHLLANDYEKFL
ncbi:MAG: D-lyxose/D-mannose family sugar isomerase [Bacteroidales bacterium]|nr:D-lyxose/D-mannose family sugar isomerase [Bacteroidales bacterium]